MSYKANRLQADLLLEQQKAIIGRYCDRLDLNRGSIKRGFEYDENADREENTDIFFYEFKKLRISFRTRINVKSCDYNDITIRSWVSSGYKTELDKINDGLGDYMLYSWGTDEKINEFIILDLDVLRQRQSEFIKDPHKLNTDGKTAFASFDLQKILRTPCCVVAELNQ